MGLTSFKKGGGAGKARYPTTERIIYNMWNLYNWSI